MAKLRRGLDKGVHWLLSLGSFFYLLPDSLELTLWACLAVYFAIQFAQQQA